ncbi:MAG TPA: toll/interleukin-1 receptor domain-containing protein [Puia sp.]|jgi:hypothetical protein|nr:toll/interleukin-1 receptor domain-containing protein [Puia sp.]
MLQVNIFISYRSKDSPIRDRIIEYLKPLEISYQQNSDVEVKIWYDENEMIGGDQIKFTISENLQKSHIVVCIFTPSYFDSKWCMFELETSVNQTRPPSKKRLLPIVYESVHWETDWLKDIKVIPQKTLQPLSNWEDQGKALVMIANEVDENIKIFVNPKALDFQTKRRGIYNTLLIPKPDLAASVLNFLNMVGEHLPDQLSEAVQLHITYSTYEQKEELVDVAELAQIKCDVVKRMFVIFSKIEEKYGIK